MLAPQAAQLRATPFSSAHLVRSSSSGRQQRQQRRLVAVRAADEQPAADEAAASAAAPQDLPKDVCQTCGVKLSEKAFGCDGTGRIAGGIGAVPGFRWWPIKAYRPCPKLSQAGLRYERKGQITDEVLFGRGRQ